MKRFEDVIDTVLASSSNYLPASYRYTCPCIMSDKKCAKSLNNNNDYYYKIAQY